MATTLQAHQLSDQEQRLHAHGGAFTFAGTGNHSRIEKIYDSFKDSKASLDLQRARYFTESFKETEGQPLTLRWAKALHHIAENIEVIIDKHQLIVGRAGKKGKYGLIYPELDGCLLHDFIQQSKTREISPIDFTDEEERIIEEEIYPYWDGKTYFEDFSKSLPTDISHVLFEPNDTYAARYIVNETSSWRSAIQWVHDYQKGLAFGFQDIKDKAEKRLRQLERSEGYVPRDKVAFWQAIAITADAIIVFAQRYSEKAAVLAFQEQDKTRKKELLEISAICAHVPRYPARTFHEAIQSQWFMQLFSRLEQKTAAVVSNGRMDQYLYPYYAKDIASGAITREDAKELLDCLWLNMAQYIDVYTSPAGVSLNEGYAHWEAVTIGGVRRNGTDATNELTYLFLEDRRDFPLNYPDLAARIHQHSPQRYLEEVAKTIRVGTGYPKLINDEEVIPELVAKGADLASAREYAVSGCAEVRMPNLDTYTSPGGLINLGAAIELTLHNGRLPRYGTELISIETGNPEDFTSWDEFKKAFIAQEQFLIQTSFKQQPYVEQIRAHHFAAPFASSLHSLCLQDEVDLHTPRIPGGIDLGYFDLIGYGSAADSLAAIKKVVYEKKYATIAEIKKALADNFEGHEELRQRLVNAPKYGNDDAYVDELAKLIDRVAVTESKHHYEQTGIHLDTRYVPATSHVPFGKVTGALPNGRKSGEALSDGTSASQGADVNGPTCVVLSNYRTKNTDDVDRAARLLNLKLNPSTISNDQGIQRLISFIRAWSALGLWHLQFNVINRETLEAAREHPENYRSLLVRVAGYSAYFVELTKELQDDIINRTEYGTI